MGYAYPGSIRASPWSGLEYPSPCKGCQGQRLHLHRPRFRLVKVFLPAGRGIFRGGMDIAIGSGLVDAPPSSYEFARPERLVLSTRVKWFKGLRRMVA